LVILRWLTRLLYTGEQIVRFYEQLIAVPVSMIWSADRKHP